MRIRSIGPLAGLLLAWASPAAAQMAADTSLTLVSRVFGNTRTLRVLLPPGYAADRSGEQRYPVFYFTDGIAAWDAWGVPAVARELWLEGAIPEYIFVGIDNGGSTTESTDPVRDRASEYLAYADPTWIEAPPIPKGDLFPRFLFDEVMPFVNERFRTLDDASRTGLAGASYGGAAALFTAMQNPGRVGLLLVESPSLHIGRGQLLRDAAAARTWPDRVYLGVGTAEDGTTETRARFVSDVRELHSTILRHPRPPTTELLVVDGGIHWYSAWRERLPDALRFLLGDSRPIR